MKETRPIDESVEPLVSRAQAGDRTALEDLVRWCYRQIYRWALVQTGDPDEADDVTQEVVLRLDSRLGSFAGRSRFTTWLYQVTRNVARERHRRGSRRAKLAQQLWISEPDEIGGEDEQLQQLDTAAVAELVRSFFRELPDRQREIFDLADLQGHTTVEVAKMLQMKPVTVRANLCKARRTIRRKILVRHPELMQEMQQ